MSSVSIQGNASGTGIFTIASPNSNTNRTLTLPDNTGTVLTSATTTGFPAGSVIQVVSQNYGTNFNSSSSTFTDTGITVSITPTSATSKILVLVTLSGVIKRTGNTGLLARLLRDSTVLQKFVGNAGFTNTTTDNHIGGVSFNYLDSPATTSTITYKIQAASGSNVARVDINVDGASNDASSITVMEIAG
jgi:hypothetical protein